MKILPLIALAAFAVPSIALAQVGPNPSVSGGSLDPSTRGPTDTYGSSLDRPSVPSADTVRPGDTRGKPGTATSPSGTTTTTPSGTTGPAAGSPPTGAARGDRAGTPPATSTGVPGGHGAHHGSGSVR